MNYKLIRDKDALQKFIDFLPSLKPNEGYFLILIARKKWNPSADIPSAVKLKRETVSHKDKIITTIMQWETEIGSYTYDNKVIPQENLSVYIAYNPKDQHTACFDLIQKCLEAIKTNKQDINIKSMANDVIQSAKGSSNFVDIDVDIKNNEKEEDIKDFIKSIFLANPQDLTFVKTNGGFHCLISQELIKRSDGWYNKIDEHVFESELNIMFHDLMPLVGCNQGTFVPFVF